MEKIKVVFRKIGNCIIAFFPELSANYGKIVYCEYLGLAPCGTGIKGGHGEASLAFYDNETEKASPDEYAEALENLQKYVYNDVELVVKQRINWNDLRNKAWERKV